MPMTPEGFVPATANEELTIIQQVFINVYGQNITKNPASLMGQFIQELANIGIDRENALSFLYSISYNLNYATGLFLDGIGSFFSIPRLPATYSRVTCEVTGLATTVIPAGSQVQNNNGDIFILEADITIGGGGTGSGNFISQVTGAINVDAGTITNIVSNVNGWSTVNNKNAGQVGADTQNDTQYRLALQYGTNRNSTNWLGALIGVFQNAIYTDNTTSPPQTYTIDQFVILINITDTAETQGGVTVEPFSVLIYIFNNNYDISTANNNVKNYFASLIYSKTICNCLNDNTSGVGNISVTYQDTKYAWQTSIIKYNTPINTPIQINVSYKILVTLPSDIVQQITDAIYNNFYGLDDLATPYIMGNTFYVSQFYQALGVLKVNILNLSVQLVTGGSPAESLTLNYNQVATLSKSDIVVTGVS